MRIPSTNTVSRAAAPRNTSDLGEDRRGEDGQAPFDRAQPFKDIIADRRSTADQTTASTIPSTRAALISSTAGVEIFDDGTFALLPPIPVPSVAVVAAAYRVIEDL